MELRLGVWGRNGCGEERVSPRPQIVRLQDREAGDRIELRIHRGEQGDPVSQGRCQAQEVVGLQTVRLLQYGSSGDVRTLDGDQVHVAHERILEFLALLGQLTDEVWGRGQGLGWIRSGEPAAPRVLHHPTMAELSKHEFGEHAANLPRAQRAKRRRHYADTPRRAQMRMLASMSPRAPAEMAAGLIGPGRLPPYWPEADPG